MEMGRYTPAQLEEVNPGMPFYKSTERITVGEDVDSHKYPGNAVKALYDNQQMLGLSDADLDYAVNRINRADGFYGWLMLPDGRGVNFSRGLKSVYVTDRKEDMVRNLRRKGLTDKDARAFVQKYRYQSFEDMVRGKPST